MRKMSKAEFMSFMEQIYDTQDINNGEVFLINALQLNYEYNDEEKTCTVSSPITELMSNPQGIVHGGVYAFIADTAMGHLTHHCKEVPHVTLELKTSYFKAVSEGEIVATARYAKEGNTVSFLACDIKNEKGEMLASTTGTFYCAPKR